MPTPVIPTRVKIGYARYGVVVSNDAIHKADSENHTNYAGFSNGSTQKIVLREDNPPDYQAETLLHEILHQCLRVAGVDADVDAKAGLADVEERAVRAIAPNLLAALRENPDLVAYLLHDGQPEGPR
ncbi:hypothetical protein Aph01nite_43560 [Acrocarpospora phusangensis]|uniref:IrrE N-terminal-like domain-containing protein n=1 Tax=Acrocarpospora phusangensis TaxID=1070424 RepID=A0A919QDP4_9ACTN|nr:hypothetical protein [Acrocarpospora phusangensis]GIH26046.1 hypothetical protein Aph01nite_43560 [Acrocarpospora phusangensis]